MVKLGKELRVIRKKHNLSMEELANKISSSYATIFRYETKKVAKPNRNICEKLQRIIEELETGELIQK